MKRILITGSNGLIGAELVKHLSSNPEYEIFRMSRTKDKTSGLIQQDLNTNWNKDFLPKHLDVIIHLAQSEKFRDFPESALEVFNVNTLSTLKLLDYARRVGVKKFIYASSGGVYGNSDTGFNENSPLITSKDLGFYLSTKFCSELLVENYHTFFDINILRFFFVFGPKQRKDMLIPRLIHSVKNKIPIKIQGEEGIKVNPIYVEDAARAISKSLDLNGSNKFNVAGSEIFSLLQIVNMISETVNIKPVIERDYNIEPKHLIADITKMKNLLTPPLTTFKEAITKMIL